MTTTAKMRVFHAYVSGALTGPGIDFRRTYEDSASVLEAHGFSVYVPHLATDPVRHPNVSSTQVYAMDRQQVAKADLIVAFLTRPSLGVGQELEIAANALVPVLLIARESEPVSRMALGSPARQYGPLRYREWTDLEPQLVQILPSIVAELRNRPVLSMPSIAEALRRARVRAGLSRAELARRVGVAEGYVTLVETAEAVVSNPSLAFVAAAAVSAGTTLSELLGTPAQDEVRLLSSLREFAINDGISFREFTDLQEMAARGLAPDRPLTLVEWRQIREARAQAAAEIKQMGLPNDDRS